MAAAFSPEMLLFGQDGLEVFFPRGSLPSQEYGCGFYGVVLGQRQLPGSGRRRTGVLLLGRLLLGLLGLLFRLVTEQPGQKRAIERGVDGRVVDLFPRVLERSITVDENNRVDYNTLNFLPALSVTALWRRASSFSAS